MTENASPPTVEDSSGLPAAGAEPATDSAKPQSLDKSNQRVQEMFRQIAPRYDLMNHLLSLNIDKLWRKQAVRRMRFVPNVPVLDICTGTGDLAFAMSEAAPAGVDVIGSDFCFAMLEFAKKKQVAKEHKNQLEFIEADSQCLPYPDNQFQCVSVAFGLRNIADTDQGLAEMTRVCRPGGQVLVLEFSKPNVLGLRQAYNAYFKHVLPRIGQWFARNNKAAYKYLPESVSHFPDGQELADRMQAAGLTDVTFKPLTFGVCTIYIGVKPEAN